MGVDGFWPIVSSKGKRVTLEILSDKVIAVDASIWIYQFANALRDSGTGEQLRASHIVGFFKRICKLLFLRVKPVFVFDGPPIPLKFAALRKRHDDTIPDSVFRKAAHQILLQNLQVLRNNPDMILSAPQRETIPDWSESDDSIDEIHVVTDSSSDGDGLSPSRRLRLTVPAEFRGFVSARRTLDSVTLPFSPARERERPEPRKDFEMEVDARIDEEALKSLPLHEQYRGLLQTRSALLSQGRRKALNIASTMGSMAVSMDLDKLSADQIRAVVDLARVTDMSKSVRLKMAVEENKDEEVYVPPARETTDQSLPAARIKKRRKKEQMLFESYIDDKHCTLSTARMVKRSELLFSSSLEDKEDQGKNIISEKIEDEEDEDEECFKSENEIKSQLFGDAWDDIIVKETSSFSGTDGFHQERDVVVEPTKIRDDNQLKEDVVGFSQDSCSVEISSCSGSVDDELVQNQDHARDSSSEDTSCFETMLNEGDKAQNNGEAIDELLHQEVDIASKHCEGVDTTLNDGLAENSTNKGVEISVHDDGAKTYNEVQGVDKYSGEGSDITVNHVDDVIPNDRIDNSLSKEVDDDGGHGIDMTSSERRTGNEIIFETVSDEELGIFADLRDPISPNVADEEAFQSNVRERITDTSDDTATYEEIQELLTAFGIPWVSAPADAEAQCAFLCQAGLVDGVVSDDSDTLIYGSPVVFRHLYIGESTVELFKQRDLGFDRNELISLALLLGCDFTEGVRGIGPVNATEIVRHYSGLSRLKEFREWAEFLSSETDEDSDEIRIFKATHANYRSQWIFPSDFPSQAVWDVFDDPSVSHDLESFSWEPPDENLVAGIVCKYTDMKEDQVARILSSTMVQYRAAKIQRRITDYFSPAFERGSVAEVVSKRLKAALAS